VPRSGIPDGTTSSGASNVVSTIRRQLRAAGSGSGKLRSVGAMLIITCNAGSCGATPANVKHRTRAFGSCQSGAAKLSPYQRTSAGRWSVWPFKNRVRRKLGWRLRSAMSSRVKRNIERAAGVNDQSSQLKSLS
jgi:hypothetical protein